MGPSPYAADPIHLNIDFLTEYRNDQQDKIDLVLLDPNYASSHHAVLTETGNDTGIFRTKIPEVNQDDDPDNDVAYDSFEVKINYPLQYPDIITRVGESFERITADSAEIDYVKKNGEYLNDFNSDKEITEEERLKFPVWRGPDYEKNDIKNYLISNMIFNQEDCESLDQTQFIPKNAKFRIVYTTEKSKNKKMGIISGTLLTSTVIGGLTFSLIQDQENKYVSEDLYMLWNDTEELSVDDEGNYFKFIKGNKTRVFPLNKNSNFTKKIQVNIEDKINKIGINNKIAYSIYNLSNFDRRGDVYTPTGLNDFTITNKYLADAGFFVVVDKSPTYFEVINILKENNIKIFNVVCHGSLKEGDLLKSYFKVLKQEKVNMPDRMIEEDFRKIYQNTEKNCDFVFLNSCELGDSVVIKYFQRAFKAEGIVSWKDKVYATYAINFMKRFYKKLYDYKVEEKDVSFKKLVDETYNSFGLGWNLIKKEPVFFDGANNEVSK